MIGILAAPEQQRAVEEFFELFKTPWECCADGRRYELVIAATADLPSNLNTKALIVYNSSRTEIETETADCTAKLLKSEQWLCWNGIEFPVYGRIAKLCGVGSP